MPRRAQGRPRLVAVRRSRSAYGTIACRQQQRVEELQELARGRHGLGCSLAFQAHCPRHQRLVSGRADAADILASGRSGLPMPARACVSASSRSSRATRPSSSAFSSSGVSAAITRPSPPPWRRADPLEPRSGRQLEPGMLGIPYRARSSSANSSAVMAAPSSEAYSIQLASTKQGRIDPTFHTALLTTRRSTPAPVVEQPSVRPWTA